MLSVLFSSSFPDKNTKPALTDMNSAGMNPNSKITFLFFYRNYRNQPLSPQFVHANVS